MNRLTVRLGFRPGDRLGDKLDLRVTAVWPPDPVPCMVRLLNMIPYKSHQYVQNSPARYCSVYGSCTIVYVRYWKIFGWSKENSSTLGSIQAVLSSLGHTPTSASTLRPVGFAPALVLSHWLHCRVVHWFARELPAGFVQVYDSLCS